MGRKRKSKEHQDMMQIQEGTAMHSVRLIDKFIRGAIKNVSEKRLRACFFNIEQVLGKARVRLEHTVGGKTLVDLAREAEEADIAKLEAIREAEEITSGAAEQG